MAKDTSLADATVNGQGDDLARRLDNGYLRIYDGTKATNADTAVGAQVLLSEHRFSATSAPGASGGLVTFSAITDDTSANASGTATWFRCLASDGTTVVMDGNVGTSGTNLVLNSTTITAGATVKITGFTHDVLNSSSGL